MPERPVLTLAPVTAPSQPVAEEVEAPDDLAGSPSEPAPAEAPVASRAGAVSEELDRPSDAAHEAAPWRQWGPFHQTVSFKWPSELASELDERRHELREPVGLMVVAALTHFLDQDDETIRSLIDRTERAKPRTGRPRRHS